jgi:hypothetical protein
MQFTEEQLARMSFKERENALELMALEEQMDAPAEPSEPEASPAPEPEVVPEPTPEPVPEPEKVEAPELSQETVDYWKQEADKWKKRKADADRALSPAQQKAAKVSKELKTKEDEWKTIALSLQQKLEALEQKLEQAPVNKPVVDDSIVSPEFEAEYGDIAAEMKRVAGTLGKRQQTELERRLAAIEERNRQLEQEQLMAQDGAYAASHYAQLKALQPDVDDFVNPNKKGTQFIEWATKQPPYIQDIAFNPLNHTPLDVSDVLNRFKSANNIVTKKPSLGDVVVKANSVPNIPEPQEEQFLSDYELKNFDSLMRQHRMNPAKMDELVKKYEATLNRNR